MARNAKHLAVINWKNCINEEPCRAFKRNIDDWLFNFYTEVTGDSMCTTGAIAKVEKFINDDGIATAREEERMWVVGVQCCFIYFML